MRWALGARLEELGLGVIEAGTVRETLEGEADFLLRCIDKPFDVDTAARIVDETLRG